MSHCTQGFEDDVSEESEEESDTTNPKVIARRRRNRERRQRLLQHKREEQAAARQQDLDEAIRNLKPGAAVLAHFKTKTGQSKKPTFMSVAQDVNLDISQVAVQTESGRVQKVPFSWILAVRNTTSAVAGAGDEDEGDVHMVDEGKRGNEKGGKNVTRIGKWLDDEKFKDMLHRRRAKARLRRRQVDVYTCACARTHVRAEEAALCIPYYISHMHLYTDTYVHIYMHTYIHVYILHMYMLTCIRTYA